MSPLLTKLLTFHAIRPSLGKEISKSEGLLGLETSWLRAYYIRLSLSFG